VVTGVSRIVIDIEDGRVTDGNGSRDNELDHDQRLHCKSLGGLDDA
jgi:hypothetical protein